MAAAWSEIVCTRYLGVVTPRSFLVGCRELVFRVMRLDGVIADCVKRGTRDL